MSFVPFELSLRHLTAQVNLCEALRNPDQPRPGQEDQHSQLLQLSEFRAISHKRANDPASRRLDRCHNFETETMHCSEERTAKFCAPCLCAHVQIAWEPERRKYGY